MCIFLIETVAHMSHPTRYHYQFAPNYGKWAANPADSPVDGNLLVALMAPRPFLSISPGSRR